MTLLCRTYIISSSRTSNPHVHPHTHLYHPPSLYPPIPGFHFFSIPSRMQAPMFIMPLHAYPTDMRKCHSNDFYGDTLDGELVLVKSALTVAMTTRSLCSYMSSVLNNKLRTRLHCATSDYTVLHEIL